MAVMLLLGTCTLTGTPVGSGAAEAEKAGEPDGYAWAGLREFEQGISYPPPQACAQTWLGDLGFAMSLKLPRGLSHSPRAQNSVRHCQADVEDQHMCRTEQITQGEQGTPVFQAIQTPCVVPQK